MVADRFGLASLWAAFGPCLAALLLFAFPTAAGEASPAGTVSGTVVGPAGEPVAGARVYTYTEDDKSSGGHSLTETKTDVQGHFRLGPIRPIYRSRSDLVVEADGYALLSTLGGTVSVYPGRDFDLGTLRLDPGRVFTGRVLDADGKPRAGASVLPRVFRHYLGHTVTDIGSGLHMTTGADGRFKTPRLPVAVLSLSVRAPQSQLASVRRLIQPGGEEDLGDIRLEKDVPVSGSVQDVDGKPIAGVAIGGTVGYDATTDAQGRFTLRGFGPNPKFQLNVSKAGYSPLIGQVVVTAEGAQYQLEPDLPLVRADTNDKKPAKELTIVLSRAGLIEGKVVDAETGEPVHLSRIVVCNFERKPSGEVVLRGCRSDGFEQPETGHFRVQFPFPDEYHLTFFAECYHDAEAFTPKVKDLSTVRGIVARIKKKTAASSPEIAEQSITGTIVRDGQPVKSGWVGLWDLRRPQVAANSPVMRGRAVVGDPIVYSSAPIHDGKYNFSVPFQNEKWYVVVEEPGHALTQVGPIAIGLREQKKLEITCVRGGHLSGRVNEVPAVWAGHAWVVAFSNTAVRAEARVRSDGTFSIPDLPPGEYGLKVGNDAYEDPEVYPGKTAFEHPESFQKKVNPWARAKIVQFRTGETIAGIEVEFPR
jgi:hypothetical protein